MASWLFKEEPSCYNFEQLERDGRTRWGGVANHTALANLRKVRQGDQIFCYHTGNEKAIVGVMKAVSDPYPDPDESDERLVVVDVAPVSRLPRPVTLAEIKADQQLADWDLVRIGRLSIVPVSAAQWKKVEDLAKASAPATKKRGAKT